MDNVTQDTCGALEKESLRIEEDSIFSAKGHYEAEGLWKVVHYSLGVPATVLAAVSSALAFQGHMTLGAVLSAGVAILAGLSTFLNPYKRETEHHEAASRYHALRNQARIFRTIDLENQNGNLDLVKRLKELAEQRDFLNQNSPIIPRLAFKRARRGIQEGEAEYSIDS